MEVQIKYLFSQLFASFDLKDLTCLISLFNSYFYDILMLMSFWLYDDICALIFFTNKFLIFAHEYHLF